MVLNAPMVLNAMRHAYSNYYLAETKKKCEIEESQGGIFFWGGGGGSFDETRLDCFDHKTRLYHPHCE